MNLNTERLQKAIAEEEKLPYKQFEKIFEERFYSIRPYSIIQVKEPDEQQNIKIIVMFSYKGMSYKSAVLVHYIYEHLLYDEMIKIADVLINCFLKQEKEILSKEG